MAHRPVGAGQSFATAAVASTSTAFRVQSSVLRLVATDAPAFVAIGTDPQATFTDYYIPAGGTATLGLTKSSQRVTAVSVGANATIDCPEGTQMPFQTGDRVTLVDANDSNYNTKISNAQVTGVYVGTGVNGLFRTRIQTDANTTGIATAFDPLSGASLLRSVRVSGIAAGGSMGALFGQHVRTSGDA